MTHTKKITMSTYQLTKEQIGRFYEDGFLIVLAAEHKLVDPIELRSWASDIQAWPKVKGKWMPYEEETASGEKILMRMEKYVDYHDGFNELLCGPALRSVLAQISGDV